MKRDVFGSKGDFITSPEISQMFGELLGVWCLNEWLQSGSPPHMQLVELGPGRGTLTEDILRVKRRLFLKIYHTNNWLDDRASYSSGKIFKNLLACKRTFFKTTAKVFSQFAEIKNKVSVHLVEVSPKLTELQRQRLCGTHSDSTTDQSAGPALSKYGPEVHWHSHLVDVPRAFSCYLAHEFFDALPIHKFQKTDRGWCEVLVDVDDDSKIVGQPKFRFVLSPGPTAASTSLFTGFKDHKLHDVLTEPGSADLTADVDFSYLKHMAGAAVSTYGPLSQETFLHYMGIRLRLQVLLQKADPKTQKDLLSGYAMLTDPVQMGERFKFFAVTSHREGEYTPAGFSPPY